jgi:hypothetical protein
MKNRIPAALLCAGAIVLVLVACGGGGGGGSEPTYSISGSVLSGEVGLDNVSISVIGPGREFKTTTDTGGNFFVTGVPNGDYTIVGSKSLYNCSSVTRTVDGADVDNVILTASSNISKSLLISDDDGNLARINIDTWEMEFIGEMKESGGTAPIVMTDIAMDPASDLLYGIDNAYLYQIDNTDATTTRVGPHGITNFPSSLVFSELGVLYAASNALYTLNKTTGAATLVGNANTVYRSSGDLAFLVNNLYLTVNPTGTGISDDLVTLNPGNGRATPVGSTGFPAVYGLATNDRTNLYGVSGTKILRIDPATGAGTEIYDYAADPSGMVAGQGLAFE